MIKSVVNEVKTELKERSYPWLGEGDNGLIVLFTQKKKGVVIVGSPLYVVGYQVSSWIMDTFKPFTGSVTLSNTD